MISPKQVEAIVKYALAVNEVQELIFPYIPKIPGLSRAMTGAVFALGDVCKALPKVRCALNAIDKASPPGPDVDGFAVICARALHDAANELPPELFSMAYNRVANANKPTRDYIAGRYIDKGLSGPEQTEPVRIEDMEAMLRYVRPPNAR